MKGVRGTDGVSFCWQDKRRLHQIEHSFSGHRRRSALLTYFVLTWLASEYRDGVFPTTIEAISQTSGVNRHAVRPALNDLQSIGLVVLQQSVRVKGRFGYIVVRLTKGRTPCINLSHGEDRSSTQSAALGSQVEAQSTVATIHPRTPIYRKKEVVVGDDAQEEEIPRQVIDAISPGIGYAWNSGLTALVIDMISQHGQHQVLRAARETAARLVDRRAFVPYMSSMLENQKAIGYTWEARERPKRKSYPVTDLSHLKLV